MGKSSTINKILNRRNFARVGGQPGKTIHINFFEIDKQTYFVDLPGYGYAKVSKSERDRWGALLETYFATGLITLGLQIVDIRHKPTADDKVMADCFLATGQPFAIIANKLDKIKKSQLEANITCIRENPAPAGGRSGDSVFSRKGNGTRASACSHRSAYCGMCRSERRAVKSSNSCFCTKCKISSRFHRLLLGSFAVQRVENCNFFIWSNDKIKEIAKNLDKI